MKATADLMKEHEGISLMLTIMTRVASAIQRGAVKQQDLDQIVEFLQGFADHCHHGKEERILFPELERLGIPRDGGPIGVMLLEHQVGREIIARMRQAVVRYQGGETDAAADIAEEMQRYVSLLINHISKENNILFPMADRVLDARLDAEIAEKFETLEVEEIGEGQHEEYHRLLKQLKERYITE